MHRFVKSWRDERVRVPVHAHVPMSFAPGEAYQFDWSHETITLQNLPLTVKAAHVKLSHTAACRLCASIFVLHREVVWVIFRQFRSAACC